MIDHTKSKSNRELLEAAKLFKFQYGKKIIKIETRTWKNKEMWHICCSGMIWNRNKKTFFSDCLYDDCLFDSVYEALETVRSLIK